MLRGIYGAAGALEMATRNQEIVAENLTHATTSGYRRQALLFDVPEITLMIKEIRVFDSIVAVYKAKRAYLPRAVGN